LEELIQVTQYFVAYPDVEPCKSFPLHKFHVILDAVAGTVAGVAEAAGIAIDIDATSTAPAARIFLIKGEPFC